MSRKKTNSSPQNIVQRAGSPNPYAIAILTAILAGVFSVIGGYFTAEFQAKQAVAQKQLEYRIHAYSSFLDKIDHEKVPAVSQIISIGSMADHLASDLAIQSFENRISDLLKKHDPQDIYWQLNSDFNTLRLHGSRRVDEICDDILKALLFRDVEINWSSYSSEVIEFHYRWKATPKKKSSLGWEERVTEDERLMVITISKLTLALIEQLRAETHAPLT